MDEVKDPKREESFEEVVERYLPRIFNLVYLRVEDYEEARDLTQEIFLKAYKAYPSFKGDSSPYTWLYRIALNHTTNFLKKRSRLKSVSLDKLFEDDPNFISYEEDKRTELREEKIREKVMDLPHPYRDVIILFYFDSMSIEDISRVLNIPKGTVKSRLSRGREILSRWLRGLWETK